MTCGEVVGVFGVRGAIKVLSETDPPGKLLSYEPWWLGPPHTPAPITPRSGRLLRGALLAVLLPGVQDRDQARAYVGTQVAIERQQFPDLAPGQFYWSDLLGLAVCDHEGRLRGTVRDIVRGPAGDVLDIQGADPLLLPFLWQKTILEVDLARGWIRVACPESD